MTVEEDVYKIAISPDGKLLASTTRFGRKKVNLWSLSDGNLVKTLEINDDIKSVSADPDNELLIFSQDGMLLISAFKSINSSTITLWNLPEGDRRIETINMYDASFIYTKSILASFNAFKICLWRLPEFSLIKSFDQEEVKDISTLAISPDEKLMITGDLDGMIKLWDIPEGIFKTCLIDLEASPVTAKGITYQQTNRHGQVITYTLPCGSPIPTGAVCTCNCVPGSYVVPPPKVTPSHLDSSGGNSYCTCNKVCTCIPVCQAHRLHHPDATVRVMAEEILYLMGEGEFEYMHWAADHAKPALQSRILVIMARIRQGAKANPSRCPSADECSQRLAHPDEIIRIMAAQMLNLHNARGLPLCADIQEQVTHWLNEAAQRPWFVRYNVKNTIAQSHPLSRA